MIRIKSWQDYEKYSELAKKDREEFWKIEADSFLWKKKYDKVTSGDFDDLKIKWFENGKLNITENCLDRHLKKNGDKIAIHFEPNDLTKKDSYSLTYKQLHEKVCQFSNGLESLGVKKGDRVCLYMSLVPELLIAVLACARIGAIHSVIFGGFSAVAIADRVKDCNVKWIITNDTGFRGAKEIALKKTIDEAMTQCSGVEKVIVFQNTGSEINWVEGRDVWWHEVIQNQPTTHESVEMDAEDILFILYTSGSTGKPKGLVHTTAGYMVYTAYSFRNVFQYNPEDVFWCTADIGWITGHSYLSYGPLLNGATQVMFEGVPTFPDAGRFWQVCDKYKVSHFYTAPTAIRSLEKFGNEFVEKYDLSSLKVLGSVGEPIDEQAWHWYNEVVGKKKCDIVDTWWQTETGGIMISPLAGITKTKPSYATYPLPGIFPQLLDKDSNEITGENINGSLCMEKTWPSIARTVYGDHYRYREVYFSTFKGKYFTGDGSFRNEDGFYRITGRVDDVVNVSGHRIGTAEVESVIDTLSFVVETAIIGFPHEIKGTCLAAFIILNSDATKEEVALEVKKKVTEQIGSFAKPEKIILVGDLPKTRSGKIMRRILRKLLEGQYDSIGDTSTLLNPEIVDKIKSKIEEI